MNTSPAAVISCNWVCILHMCQCHSIYVQCIVSSYDRMLYMSSMFNHFGILKIYACTCMHVARHAGKAGALFHRALMWLPARGNDGRHAGREAPWADEPMCTPGAGILCICEYVVVREGLGKVLRICYECSVLQWGELSLNMYLNRIAVRVSWQPCILPGLCMIFLRSSSIFISNTSAYGHGGAVPWTWSSKLEPPFCWAMVLVVYPSGPFVVTPVCINMYLGVVLHSHVCAYTFNYKYTNTSLV